MIFGSVDHEITSCFLLNVSNPNDPNTQQGRYIYDFMQQPKVYTSYILSCLQCHSSFYLCNINVSISFLSCNELLFQQLLDAFFDHNNRG